MSNVYDNDTGEMHESTPDEDYRFNDLNMKHAIENFDWAAEDPRHADYLARRRDALAEQETRSIDMYKGVE